jgi:DNA polymerase V
MAQARQGVTLFTVEDNGVELPLVAGVKAGFPSPAADYLEEAIDLNRYVIRNKAATFYARIDGNSMEPILSNNDLVVVDRSLSPVDGDIALCYIDGEFTVKTIQRTPNAVYLIPANRQYDPITVTKDNELIIWGIITHSIRKHRR